MILSDWQHLIENPSTKVVEKQWGTEFWLCNTSNYCWKLLQLNQDYRCSLHFHKLKTETFFVLSGHVKLELPDVTVTLLPGDNYNIYPGMEHRFTGITDALISEISTPHYDSDSYRSEPSGKTPLLES